MTAAKVIDVKARLQTADAVSACTQVRVSRHLDTSTTTQNGPNGGPTSEEPVVVLERNLNGHPFAGLLWERHFEEVLLELGWEECLFVHRKQRFFLSVYVDDIKMTGRKQNMALHGNSSILENQHPFLTTCTWDALNVNASRMKVLLKSAEKCSNHEVLLQQLKITRMGKTSRNNCRAVVRYGGSCEKVC